MVLSLSYWELDTWYDNHDFVIIGSGIVGLTTALALRKYYPTNKIIIIERGYLPIGGSTKNAGFLCIGSVGELIANIKTYGEVETIKILRRRIEGLQLLKDLTLHDDIGYQPCGGYEIGTEEQPIDSLIEHIPYLNALIESNFGYKDTFCVKHHHIGRLSSQQIYNQYEGSIHTGKMMSTLIGKCHAAGILFLTGTEVTSVTKVGNQHHIKSRQGSVKGKTVICCTNAFTPQLVSNIDIQPKRNQVILTSPIDHQLPQSCFHFDEGYLYFRPIGQRILIGGARNVFPKTESTLEVGNTSDLTEWLRSWVRTYLAVDQVVNIELQWSGILGTGLELQPLIKEVERHLYIAARMNGMGIAIGAKVGYDVAEMIRSSEVYPR